MNRCSERKREKKEKERERGRETERDRERERERERAKERDGKRQRKVMLMPEVQGYLAHQKPTPPRDHHRALGIGLLQGPRGGRFFLSEVPLYLEYQTTSPPPWTTAGS